MLIIRKEPMEAFENVFIQKFIMEAVEYVKKHWPKELQTSGEAEARASIESAIERCDHAGITDEEYILRFMGMKYSLGNDFDSSSEHPSATAKLGEDSLDQCDKIEQL